MAVDTRDGWSLSTLEISSSTVASPPLAAPCMYETSASGGGATSGVRLDAGAPVHGDGTGVACDHQGWRQWHDQQGEQNNVGQVRLLAAVASAVNIIDFA